MDDSTKLLTLKEVAALYRITEKTALNLANSNMLPGAFKVAGTMWRVEQDKLFKAWGAPE